PAPKGVKWEEMKGGTGFYSWKDIEQFVAPLPERVFLSAENFEKRATVLLQSEQFGYHKLSPTLQAAPPILRIFLTTGKGFKKRLRDRASMGHHKVEAVYRNLP